MVVIICGKYGNNRSWTEDVTERTRFSNSRSNELEDIGQRSSQATHHLMLVIICTKYGKNPSRTVDATARTRFLRPRPNDLEDIAQGQRSLYATPPSYQWSIVLNMEIIHWELSKNFQGQGRNILKICQKFKFPDPEKNITRDTPSNDSNHLCQI